MAGDGVMALVLNSGSSSLKYGIFVTNQGAPAGVDCLGSGLCDKIGLEGCNVSCEDASGKKKKMDVFFKDHGAALKQVVEILTGAGGPVKSIGDIKVIGHRVVHGGPRYSEPTIVDDAVYKEIEAVIPLAPLHNPANLLGIKMAKELFQATQVAVFDTAFHGTMPPESYRYALPKELYEKHNVRRYGFHGTSYKYVSQATADALGQPLEQTNMIICHLGNGGSMACLKNGKVVDTTMGLTPLEGLVMGTRSGDVDCGVYTYLVEHVGMKPKEVDNMLNKKSGMLGLSGMSDMRDNIKAAADGNPDAALARAVYVERVRKYIGAFLVKLNGELDALVFTAGVGENDKGLRELACAGLFPLGIEVDPMKNAQAKGDAEIQSTRSRAKIMVIPTEEELSIATQSLEITGFMKKKTVTAASKPKQSTPRPTIFEFAMIGLAIAPLVLVPLMRRR